MIRGERFDRVLALEGLEPSQKTVNFPVFEHLLKMLFFKPRVLIALTFTVWIFLFESDEKHDFSNSAKSKQPIQVGASLF